MEGDDKGKRAAEEDDAGDDSGDSFDGELEDTDDNDKGKAVHQTMASPRTSDEPPAKQAKLSRADLYKPPTNEELNQLKETENLFHSTLFRMQITELLSEVKLKEGRRKQMNKAVETMKSLLLSLPQTKKHELDDQIWLKKTDCKIPLHNSQVVKGSFQFVPPTKVKVTGSFLHETCVKPNIHVDLVLEMPKACLDHKDFINHRYLRKRALYLTYIAAKLGDSAEVEDLQFTYHHGNHMKPTLVVTVKVEGHKSVKVNLYVVPEEGYFKLNRFNPNKNNVRSQWYHGGTEEKEISEDQAPTPVYNSTLLEDLTLTSNNECLQRLHDDISGLKEGIILLKIWLRQRELDRGYGSFSGFIMSMYVMFLLAQRKLNIHMSSYQVMRNTLLKLSESDWPAQGITMCRDASDPNQPDIGTFHTSYDVVFIDPTGYHNLCSDMLESTYCRVKHEAELAIKMMEDKTVDSFDMLFMKKIPFTHTFDHIFHIAPSRDLEQSVDKLDKQTSLIDHGGHYTYCCLPALIEKLQRGLGKRIKLVQLKHEPTHVWSVDENPPYFNKPETLTFGLLLDGEFSSNILDRGPSADSQEAEEFRQFWGEKSELRRFQDGGICEAVLWTDKTTVNKKRNICSQIVKYILERHAGIQPPSVHYVADQVDPLLHLPVKFKSQSDAQLPYGTGEEQNVRLLHVYDELCKMVRKLSNLPLTITSMQGTSPCFRYAEVFTPLPATFSHKGPQAIENDVKMFVPATHIPCPPYTPTLKVICSLEGSGKWPEDYEAMRRLKAAFHIQLGDAIKTSYSLPVRVGATFVDVLKDHYVFRLVLAYTKEIVMLKTIRTAEGMIRMRDTEDSLRLERETKALPRLTSTLHGLQQQYNSFGTTVRLAKRWICAQMLGDFIHEVAVELIVASFYLSPYPHTSPRSGLVGFKRFLNLLATHDWKTTPLMVNLNHEFTAEDLTEIPNRFSKERTTLPLMFISTPLDKYSSHWTKKSPTVPILQRLVLLAQKSLEGQIKLGSNPDFKPIFRPPLDVYDVLIFLNHKQLPRQHEAIDMRVETNIRQYGKSTEDDRFPITDFDPVQMYLKELRVTFDDLALFFHDKHGGGVIGVLWKPTALNPKDFKVSHINYSKPLTDSAGGRGVSLAPNIDAILEDFKILGEGLVEKLQTKTATKT